MSTLLDEKGNTPNPYARLAEFVDERIHGAKSHASDGEAHEVDVPAWTDLINAMLREKASGTCEITQTVHAANKSVNFAIRGLTQRDVSKIAGETKTWLPTGCEFRIGDATADSSRATRVARPPKKEFFIKVTERAQSNLEWRRKVWHKAWRADVCVLLTALIAACVLCYMLYQHGAGHRDPFGTLAEAAARALKRESPVPGMHAHK